MVDGDDLAIGLESAGRLAWGDAYRSLRLAERSGPLAGEDLEVLAAAAYLLGHVDECRQALQRGHRAYLAADNPRRAARCLFWVAFTLLLEGDLAPAEGWLARAHRVSDLTIESALSVGFSSCRTLCWLAERATLPGARSPPRGRQRLVPSSATSTCCHSRCISRAERWCGRAGCARVLALLDEAMVAVIAEEVWPPVAGNLYCSMIDACHEISDLRRAHEWTAALENWWAKQPDMVTFTGQCLVHRAELLQLQGAWSEAIEEVERARERLARAADKYATGAALYREAEIHRALGDFPSAEDGYRGASQWGNETQPGLALLRLAEGDADAAAASSRRVVVESADRVRRTQVLPAHVEIMLAIGDVPAAREAADELAELAEYFGTAALHAHAGRALGGVLLAEGDARGALGALRRAWDLWRELEAPYEAAGVRVLIALSCRALGDEDSAALELDSALRVFRDLGARPDVTRVEVSCGGNRPHGRSR